MNKQYQDPRYAQSHASVATYDQKSASLSPEGYSTHTASAPIQMPDGSFTYAGGHASASASAYAHLSAPMPSHGSVPVTPIEAGDDYAAVLGYGQPMQQQQQQQQPGQLVLDQSWGPWANHLGINLNLDVDIGLDANLGPSIVGHPSSSQLQPSHPDIQYGHSPPMEMQYGQPQQHYTHAQAQAQTQGQAQTQSQAQAQYGNAHWSAQYPPPQPQQQAYHT
jgi:hypothetical protein